MDDSGRFQELAKEYRDTSKRDYRVCNLLLREAKRLVEIVPEEDYWKLLRITGADVSEGSNPEAYRQFHRWLTRHCGLYFLTETKKLPGDVTRMIIEQADRFNLNEYKEALLEARESPQPNQASRIRDRNLLLLARDAGLGVFSRVSEVSVQDVPIWCIIRAVIRYYRLAVTPKALKAMASINYDHWLGQALFRSYLGASGSIGEIEALLAELAPYADRFYDAFSTPNPDITYYESRRKLVESYTQLADLAANPYRAWTGREGVSAELVAIARVAELLEGLPPSARDAVLVLDSYLPLIGGIEYGKLMYLLIVNRHQLAQIADFSEERIPHEYCDRPIE